MTILLEAQGLAKTFTLHERGGLQLPVFAGVDLQVAAGECLALTGRSGSGKSSLLRCLYGNYAPSAGSVSVRHEGDAVDLARATPREVLAVRRHSVGYVSQFLRAIPTPMLVPVFLVLFRIGTQMESATIVFGAIWPVLLNTADGVASVDPQHLTVARAFRLPRGQVLWRVVLPSALPKILAGLRLGLALSLILMVFAEMVGSTGGIGYELVNAQSQFDMAGMWAVVVLLGMVGYLLNAVLVAAERLLLRHRGGEEV